MYLIFFTENRKPKTENYNNGEGGAGEDPQARTPVPLEPGSRPPLSDFDSD
jgi:hypothetical protein